MSIIPNLDTSISTGSTTTQGETDAQSGGVAAGAISFGTVASGNASGQTDTGLPQTPAQSLPDISILGFNFPWWEGALGLFVLYLLFKKRG